MGIMESRLIHGTVGFAIGDALGLPVKGQNAAELTAAPVTTMKGYGTFSQPAGTYSDETGLALAGLDALQHGFDEQALIKAYQAWFTAGKYAPYGKRSPDIWPSIETALKAGQSVAAPKEPGALIRILPFAFFAYQTFDTSLFQKAEGVKVLETFVHITNQDAENLVAAGIYMQIAVELLGATPDLPSAIATGIDKAGSYFGTTQPYQPIFEAFQAALADDKWPDGSATDPISLLARTLKALQSKPDYHDAVLQTVNQGGATDTTGALVGGLAGLTYGYTSLPHRWCLMLAEYAQIVDLCRQAENSGFFPKYD